MLIIRRGGTFLPTPGHVRVKPDFFAFENRLPFLLICRFSSVLIHGRFCLEPDSLEGMSVFKSFYCLFTFGKHLNLF